MRNMFVPTSVLNDTESAIAAVVFKTAYLLPAAVGKTVTIKVTLHDDDSITATVEI